MTNTALAIVESSRFNSELIDLIKRTICAGSSNDELSLFLIQCQRTGLDPFARQIHAVKRWDNKENRQVMSIQIGIDGFRLIAERTDKYAPSREPSYTHDANGNLISATAYVKKFAGGTWHEVAASAFYEEYVQTNANKQPLVMWAKMPRLMLAKCAEALALRRAFPAELSGLYTPDEMAQADNGQTLQPEPTTSERFAAKCEELDYIGKKSILCRAILDYADSTELTKSDYAACLEKPDPVWRTAIRAVQIADEEPPTPNLALISTEEVPVVETNHNLDAFGSGIPAGVA